MRGDFLCWALLSTSHLIPFGLDMGSLFMYAFAFALAFALASALAFALALAFAFAFAGRTSRDWGRMGLVRHLGRGSFPTGFFPDRQPIWGGD